MAANLTWLRLGAKIQKNFQKHCPMPKRNSPLCSPNKECPVQLGKAIISGFGFKIDPKSMSLLPILRDRSQRKAGFTRDFSLILFFLSFIDYNLIRAGAPAEGFYNVVCRQWLMVPHEKSKFKFQKDLCVSRICFRSLVRSGRLHCAETK